MKDRLDSKQRLLRVRQLMWIPVVPSFRENEYLKHLCVHFRNTSYIVKYLLLWKHKVWTQEANLKISPNVPTPPAPPRSLPLSMFIERKEAYPPWKRPLFCSCWMRIFSNLSGLGMKPISQPSFTSLPIHQSLLYFWNAEIKLSIGTYLSSHCTY